MDLLKFIAFISSGIGQFIIIAVIIGCFIPEGILFTIYAHIVVIIFIILLIVGLFNLFFKW